MWSRKSSAEEALNGSYGRRRSRIDAVVARHAKERARGPEVQYCYELSMAAISRYSSH
jgi:hypothetical protein